MTQRISPMAEAICRALCKANGIPADALTAALTVVAEPGEPAWMMFLDMVDVMVESLREPSPEMFAAYMNALENPADQRRAAWHRMKMLKRWKAMLNEVVPA